MIFMPAMSSAQAASWHGVMDLHERLDRGWTLVGGQMVHLHCAEHGHAPPRPTNDVDTVIDVRADPAMLSTFTCTLVELGFTAGGFSAEGVQHRDFRSVELSQKDRRRLRQMLEAVRADRGVMNQSDDVEEALIRVERAARLS